jgi:hypothetical protein
MRRQNVLVFDDFVATTSAGGTTVQTDARFNDVLAQFDQLGLFAVTDQTSAVMNVTAQIQHSPDQRNWINKNAGAEVTIAALVNTTVVGFGSDAGTTPLHAFVRLVVGTSAAGQVHVKVWACSRDQA